MAELPLRERKYAATKAALMEAFVARLGEQGIDDVAVKDVCRDVQVSETTFFNYFPAKKDLICYCVQIWSIRVSWGMQQHLEKGGGHLDAIRLLFDLTGQQEEKYPGGMREIIVLQVRDALSFKPLTPAEFAHHFPDMPEAERRDVRNVTDLLMDQLVAAQQAGELAADLNLETFLLTLLSVFFMTPVFSASRRGGKLRAAYQRQLDFLLPR